MRCLFVSFFLVVWSLAAIALAAPAPPPISPVPPASPSAAPATIPAETPTVVVVIGAEGAPEFRDVFNQSADRWADAAKRASAHYIEICRTSDAALSDKQRLKQTLEAEVKNPSDPLWLVFIGHGTYDGHEAKFNLRGEDFSDQELAQWLLPCVRPLAVIDCSSASGPFLNRLSAKGRVIITATKSGSEVNYVRFGEYFSVAITDPAADLDKDGQTSLLEAFLAASHHVEEFYKREGRLATEHALLDDNGDGKGVSADWFQGVRPAHAAKDGTAVDGAKAHQWHLLKSADEQALTSEQRASRDDLEAKIEALRAQKASLSEADYYARLDQLLVSLARVYQPANPK